MHGNIKNLNINQIMSLVGKTYRRIDIRAILARPLKEPDVEWTCIFLKVRMTKESQNELDGNQHNDMRLGNINKPFFRIEFTNSSIECLDSILKDIASGHITFGSVDANLPSTRCKDILSNSSSVSDMYTTDDEKAGYIHLLIFTTMELSIAGQIQKLGLTPDQIGIKISELHTWFNTSVLDDGQINNVVLLFPVYCRHITLPRSERNNTIAKYEIHTSLVDQCSAKVVDVNKPAILKIMQRDDFGQIQKTTNNNSIISIPTVDRAILTGRPLRIQIWHSHLGLIREDNIDVSYLLETPYNEDGSMKEVGPFHVFVESKVARPWNRNWVYEINLTKDQILRNFITPFKKNNEKIVCNGEVFETKDVSRLRVYYTADRLEGGAGRNDQSRLDGIVNQNGRDMTREFLEEWERLDTEKRFVTNSKQVFIVHGHDSDAKWELVRMVEKEFGLEAIILEEQADMGRTIIEKFENFAELPGYAFVLLTPDDVGGENTEGIEIDVLKTGNKRLKDLNINFKPRARQNVILELGYFYARLHRKRVCCLYKEGVEIPSDISGVIYKKFTKSIKEMEGDIRRELRAVGYDV